MMKKLQIFMLLILLGGSYVSAQSFLVTVAPALELPVGTSADLYTTGGGVDLVGMYTFNNASGLRLSATAGYRSLPSQGTENLSLYSLSGGIGYQYEMIPRLRIYSDVRAGGFFGTFGGASGFDFVADAEIGLDFAMSSSFSLGLGTSYSVYLVGGDPLYTGMGIKVIGSFTPGRGGTSKSRLKILNPQIDPIFPVFYKWYDNNPAGSITIENRESRTIRNVQASIFVQEFMDTPKVFAELEELGKGDSIDIPVYMLFNDGILSVTESTKVAGEISVSYDISDDSRQQVHAETLRIFDRNAITWSDDRSVASFVTPRDPALLSFAKNVAGAVRRDGEVVGDINFRVAMAMYEALDLYGLSYVIDPKSSYADLSAQSEAVDYVQFPRQTLQYRSGDCDDLTILYNSLLEAVGIETAFILVPGHILPAVALTLSVEEAQRQFSRPDRLIVDQGVVYLPIEATIISKGFNAAWVEGARQWQNAGSSAQIISVRDAWKEYEAVGLREAVPELIYPASDTIIVAYRTQMERFISEELAPRVDALESDIRNRGATPRNQNKLGILYARYGRYVEAETEFRKILSNSSYSPAMVNLANVFYMREDYSNAAQWYDRALQQTPENKYALRGSIKANTEMGEVVVVANLLEHLRNIDPASADSLAHLATADTGTEGRASSAQAERFVDWED